MIFLGQITAPIRRTGAEISLAVFAGRATVRTGNPSPHGLWPVSRILGLGRGGAIAAQPGTVIRRIWPSPGAGPPKPRLDTYSAPSGPRVIAVGNDSPVAITV